MGATWGRAESHRNRPAAAEWSGRVGRHRGGRAGDATSLAILRTGLKLLSIGRCGTLGRSNGFFVGIDNPRPGAFGRQPCGDHQLSNGLDRGRIGAQFGPDVALRDK